MPKQNVIFNRWMMFFEFNEKHMRKLSHFYQGKYRDLMRDEVLDNEVLSYLFRTRNGDLLCIPFHWFSDESCLELPFFTDIESFCMLNSWVWLGYVAIKKQQLIKHLDWVLDYGGINRGGYFYPITVDDSVEIEDLLESLHRKISYIRQIRFSIDPKMVSAYLPSSAYLNWDGFCEDKLKEGFLYLEENEHLVIYYTSSSHDGEYMIIPNYESVISLLENEDFSIIKIFKLSVKEFTLLLEGFLSSSDSSLAENMPISFLDDSDKYYIKNVLSQRYL